MIICSIFISSVCSILIYVYVQAFYQYVKWREAGIVLCDAPWFLLPLEMTPSRMPSHVLTRHHLSDQISHQVKKPQTSVSCRWLEARELSPEGIIEVNQSRGKPVPGAKGWQSKNLVREVSQKSVAEGSMGEWSLKTRQG